MKTFIIEEKFVGYADITIEAETEEEAIALYNRGHYPDSSYDIEFKCLKYVTDNADESSAKSWEENIATGSVLFQEWLKSNDYMPLQKAAHQM